MTDTAVDEESQLASDAPAVCDDDIELDANGCPKIFSDLLVTCSRFSRAIR
jgi:hypothetical protein